MINPKQISINDFTYSLSDDKIALYPLSKRDESKLLIYNEGVIKEDRFIHLSDYLPNDSFLVFNDTKVIPARVRFTKPSGGTIEIFLLEPFETDYATALTTTKKHAWKCMIGGAGKWKESMFKLSVGGIELSIEKKEKISDTYVIEFAWDADKCFAEVLELAGDTPLPPYIKRKTETSDIERYQTVYAREQGSVAAPTAGLHFTSSVFNSFPKKNMRTGFVTLHVGAGTFKPVKAAIMQDHEMHAEWIEVDQKLIESLIQQLNKTIVAVGTTSTRTLESIYWIGVKVYLQPHIKHLNLNQWEVYESPLNNSSISTADSLHALLGWMKKNKLEKLITQSQIIIAPGYSFKIISGLVTNFHQPKSTLLLLVAAAIGENWKNVYDYALKNSFRFLSYGDGSLLFIEK